MPDRQAFIAAVPIRCFSPVCNRPRWICGQLAQWQRIDRSTGQLTYFCDEHQRPGDAPIGVNVPIRRVSLFVEVVFSGGACDEAQAIEEALNRLNRAVESVGGVVNLMTTSSRVGHWTPPRPAGRGEGMRGRG